MKYKFVYTTGWNNDQEVHNFSMFMLTVVMDGDTEMEVGDRTQAEWRNWRDVGP